jgi:arylsulfatase A-like enzyme/Flp pilus assembly protein TadD
MVEKKKKLVAFLLISLFMWGFPEAVNASRLNILLVTFDTTRADHIRCYGYKDIKTPNIDRLAKEGCLFEKAFTPVPITFPAHASMLTGLYPPTHGIRNNATYALSESVITLPELLKERGYKTAAFISAYVLDRRFGLDQGFDIYDDDLETGVEPKLSQKERRAETVTKAAIKWLERVGDESFFLWVHYFDPHDAWSPPPPYSEEYANNPYDGEIAYADHWLGKLLDKLHKQKLTKNTLIVLAGDHGEGLGDHHEKTHGIFIYDATIWVPLIFSCPRILPKSRRISSLVRLVDITPTILEIIAYKIPEHMQGVSLSPWMLKKAKNPELALYCETFYPKSTHNWSPLKGLRTKTWKYIEAPIKELYRTLEMDKETQEKLRSLGYVWTPTSGEERKEYPDPKEMINVLEYVDKGAAYFAEAQYEKAAPLFKKVLELHPEDTEAYVTLGHIYEAMGENEKSIESFEKALELEPENLRIYIQLGVSYMKAEQYEKGLETFRRALDFNPRCKEAYSNMGLYHFKIQEWSKAKDLFQQVLDLDPRDSLANNYLSVVYQRLGDYEKAMSRAEAVLEKDPNNITALLNLGSIYQSRHRLKDALDVLRQAVRIKPDLSKAHYFLGLVYFQQERFQDAIDAFNQAIKYDPKSAESHFNLGFIYMKQNNLEKAIQEFQTALNIKPDFIQARQMLLKLYPMLQKED